MMTTLLFPGQGSQAQGMGEGLWDKFPDHVAQADEILGYSIRELCESEDGRLNQTCFTQPALYVVSSLQYLEWKEGASGDADYAAGHSVGEYAALFAAGYIEFADGLRMVQKRGELMHQQSGGGMAAVLGMDLDAVQKVLLENADLSGVDIANINAPEQIVLSGKKEDIEQAQAAFEAAGARRFVVLNVSGAFHSRYMQEPGQEYREFIQSVAFREPKFPVISNLEAKPYDLARAQDLLVKQIYSPVQWVDSILFLRSRGEMEFLELGPGKVLTGLLRRIR
jgi:trans-AT polyketide synthase/acyltransferase/oxidoreductase domain-containing protein